jgi:hypothetical protein
MTESTMMETDNSTNTTTTTTKEVNDDQMIKDQKSQTLIANVHLIKKSVEVKGEPRFIANVFRQVSSRSRSLIDLKTHREQISRSIVCF